MPVWLRNYTFKRIQEYFDKEQEKIDKRQKQMTNKQSPAISKPAISPKSNYTMKAPTKK